MNEESLMQMTKEALADALGREPTEREIRKTHYGFKRMALIMYEHLEQEIKKDTTLPSTLDI